MASFVQQTGSLSLRFFIYRPMGADKSVDETITDTNPAYIELRRQVDAALPGFSVWPEVIKTGAVKKLCPQLWQRIGCDPLGEMNICCGVDEPLKGPNSNLFDAEPNIVFNHPVLVDMRQKLLDENSEPPEVCKTCNLLGDPGW